MTEENTEEIVVEEVAEEQAEPQIKTGHNINVHGNNPLAR